MRKEWWATALFFACNGAVYGSIFSRLPEVVDRYSLTPGLLGVVLVVPVFTSFLGSAAGGRVVVRYGARRVSRVSLVILAISLGLMTASPLLAGLVAALVVLGAADGVMDVAMNMHAVDLEVRAGRAVMQGLHAAWTAGALVAAISAGLVAGFVPLVLHIALAATMLGVIGVLLPGWWEPVRTAIPGHQEGSWRALGWIAVVAVAVSLAESVPIDWASVVLSEVFDATSGGAAAATAVALAGMRAGRIVGDRIIGRFGARRTLVSFAALTGTGATLAGFAPNPTIAYSALFLAGAGSSVMFPGMISIAGRISDDGVAAVTAAARLGFMIGPIVTGLVADSFGFRPIMALPALAALAVGMWASGSAQVSDRVRPSP
ncbi:MAG: MFS transporter [Acidimicrobiia bacterium]|nr:MFS transporter [Acidimicrobiia bacterium]